MWVKRPEKQYRREALKKGFTYLVKPWWITFLVTVLSLMSYRLYRGVAWATDPPAVKMRAVVTIICFALLLHLVAAEVFRHFGQKNKVERVICDKCHNVKIEDGTVECSCGGTYIDINRMQWVDEEHAT